MQNAALLFLSHLRKSRHRGWFVFSSAYSMCRGSIWYGRLRCRNAICCLARVAACWIYVFNLTCIAGYAACAGYASATGAAGAPAWCFGNIAAALFVYIGFSGAARAVARTQAAAGYIATPGFLFGAGRGCRAESRANRSAGTLTTACAAAWLCIRTGAGRAGARLGCNPAVLYLFGALGAAF